MKKLHRFKGWYSMEEASSRLSLSLAEEVTEGDVVQLAAEGHITVCWFLDGSHYARRVAVFCAYPRGDVSTVYSEPLYDENGESWGQSLSGLLTLPVALCPSWAWWLLTFIGKGGESGDFCGPLVIDEDGTTWELYDEKGKGDFFHFPKRSEVVIRRNDLEAFEHRALCIANANQSTIAAAPSSPNLRPIVYEAAAPHVVTAAVASIIAPGEDVTALQREIESEGWRFVLIDGDPTVHIPDGTVQGQLEPLDHLYSLVCGLCYRSKNPLIAKLVKSSGASGGGARQSNIARSSLAHSLDAAEVVNIKQPAAQPQQDRKRSELAPIAPLIDQPTRESKTDDPWSITDSRDANLEKFEPWGTPARYFARQMVREDAALLRKRAVLAEKVAVSLADAGIRKRGGVRSPDPTTILKAFSKLDFS